MILRSLAIFAFFIPALLSASPLAREVLAEINLARTQPQEYAQIVANNPSASHGSEGARAVAEAVAFLQGARPVPPLSWSRGIAQAAATHATDVGTRGGRGHTGSGGSTPWRRMARFGQWKGHAGENIDYGHADPRSIVISLIVDHGVGSRAHRKNLFSRDFGVTGIAVSPHAAWGTVCVMNFASDFVEMGERRLVDRVAGGLRTEYMGKSFF